MQSVIYHILTLEDFKDCTKGDCYRSRTFEEDGFIHCTPDEPTSLHVLEDYFAEASERNLVLIIGIDTSRLRSEVRYESPVPVQGMRTSDLTNGILFPHIYGSVNIDAVVGVGKAERVEGRFVWPSAFDTVEKYL